MKPPRKTKQRTPRPATGAASQVDGDLVAKGYQKLLAKQELSRAEREAIKRHERKKEEELRWRFYGAIPQRHWRQMSGRQTKVLHEQAARYGIPFGGRTIDLPAVVKALHDFLAENAAKLVREDDVLLQGGNSPALERYREHRAELAQLDVEERRRRLLPRDRVRAELARIATVIRGAGETLQRDFGPGAAEILYEALDDAQRKVERAFDEEPVGEDDSPDAA